MKWLWVYNICVMIDKFIYLSIDEQMVPYFGRHSCKMYIKGKPIRFGFNLWCLYSSKGYLFSCSPYGGAEESYDKNLGLGAQTI